MFSFRFVCVCRFELKHLNETIDLLEKRGKVSDDKTDYEPGVLEKILMKDKKIAFNMSYDMLVAGIDTVS